MTIRLPRIIAGLALAVSAMPLLAHHALVAVFDPSNQKEFKGTVTRVEWLNPHARFDMDVAEPGGKAAHWEFELGSPNSLVQHGWTRYTLKIGDIVAVTGDLARDGSKFAHVRSITLPGGARVCDYDRFNDAAWSCASK